MEKSVKCRSDDVFGNKEVKRGKPREREIQNWQESSNKRNEWSQGPRNRQIDVCRLEIGTEHGLFIFIVYLLDGVLMKELGEYLKRTRIINKKDKDKSKNRKLNKRIN